MPKVTWYRNGIPLDSNLTGGRFEDNFQKLIIIRLVEEDSGDYACYAENVAGTIMRNVSLSVTIGKFLIIKKSMFVFYSTIEG